MTPCRLFRLVAGACLLWMLAQPLHAEPFAEARLEVRGMSLELVSTLVDLNLGSPGIVQTAMGGHTNGDAPAFEGLVAEGELVGPGLSSPITLRTAPGHAFSIPGLAQEGEYVLQNVRLTSNGSFVAPAVPSFATIRVSNTLKTEVSVRQLTADELRRRGIVVDSRNFDVYEYTFTFYVDGQTVEIPYPVIIDARTREVYPVVTESPFPLPTDENLTPPRFTPPTTVAFDLGVDPGELPPASSPTPGVPPPSRPSIPAALVIPSNLAVLHQFFGVAIVVTNGAPPGSEVRLDRIGATIRTPDQLRVARSEPSVAFGQAVPVEGPDGSRFLVAQAQGQAEWTVEGLRPGTYTIDVDVRATMISPGQPDLALKGTRSASVVIHDPRFNVTFSHPSSVHATLDPSSDANAYSAFAFVTNLSPNEQTVVVSSGLPSCGATISNVCLTGGDPASETLTLQPGEVRTIEYRLKSNRTGTFFASSMSTDGGAIELGFVVRDGENGNPATLVMPWYARYLDEAFVNAQLELLGRAFAIATAPVTQSTSTRPNVIPPDVYRRAVDIARAGQRVFITTDEANENATREGARFAYSNLALELLGARDGRRSDGAPVDHANLLREWDQLRRSEASGRTSSAALAREMEATFAAGDAPSEVFDHFVDANAHRSDFVAALVHGGNARIRVHVASGETVGVNDAGTHEFLRGVPFADVHRLTLPDGTPSELGLVGSVASEVTLTIEATGPFELDLVYPGGELGAPLRLSHRFGDAAPHTFRLRLVNGEAAIDTSFGDPAPLLSGTPLQPPPVGILAARQDLHLDPQGHKVSLLFNRPVRPDGDLREVFDGAVAFVEGALTYQGRRPIGAAALQDDGRILNVTFDHALHANVARRPGCSYTVSMPGSIVDPVDGTPYSGLPVPVPRVDDDRPAAAILGRVIAGTGDAVTGADVVLWAGPPQYDRSSDGTSGSSAGAFFFESVPLDPGVFDLEAITVEGKRTALSGSVRNDGQVYLLDLQFLGRGGARGFVRAAEDGSPVEGARVVVSNRLFGGFRSTSTDARGFYEVSDLAVGPVTFVATDTNGNVTYAAGEIGVPGQVVEQDLVIRRAAQTGFGTIRGVVRRSDDGGPVPGAHVAVFAQSYGLVDGYADAAGRFEFSGVPSGFVTVLAEEWVVAWQSAALDFDLGVDEIRDVALTLMVRGSGETFVRVEGNVTKSRSGMPAEPVPGALVLVDGLQLVTADANGHYVYESVPQSFTGRRIRAHDPASGRQAEAILPTLVTGTNNVPLHVEVDAGSNAGTIRARVLDSTGLPLSAGEIRVVAKGLTDLTPTGEPGVFEMRDVAVGRTLQLFAVPSSSGSRLGDQVATGMATVGFADQMVSVTLRLPGQGDVDVSLVSNGVRQLGDVRMSYRVWSEAEQALVPADRLPVSTQDPPGSGLAGHARFSRVPVGRTILVAADLAAAGTAAAERRLTWDGQLLQVDLELGTRASVSGRVVSFDGLTPVEGATVTITDGRQDPGPQTTRVDGTFTFADVPADTEFVLVADRVRDGVRRMGAARGRTPLYGGSVEDLTVTLLRRGDVRGRVVWADRQLDPADGTTLVPDTTPGRYDDNAPVPRAAFHLRELEFPSRSFGTDASPLRAANDGSFVVANVMEGPFRVTAAEGDFRGHATGAIELDGEVVELLVVIGGEGSGELEVAVLDPDHGFAGVPSAEVRVFRNGSSFDVGSTDATGRVLFPALPAVGTYSVSAYSKALGRSGSTTSPVVLVPDSRVFADVLLEVSGTVRGTLTDAAEAGAGVAGAHVDLDASDYRTRSTTGTGGTFVFEGVREGTFRLEARDPSSNRRARGDGTITRLDQNESVDLELPPWSSLRVRAFLPGDGGGSSGTLAPLVRAEVRQLCHAVPNSLEPKCDELQSAEGNDIVFPRLLEGEYTLVVQELGGGGRTLEVEGALGRGEISTRDVVFTATGPVRVRVVEQTTGSPMPDIKVSVYAGGRSFVGYTDGTGVVTAPSMPVGWPVSVSAVTLDGLLSGSATGTVVSASVPLELTIGLRSLATITGYVAAESGGPSIGTAVAIGTVSTVTGGDGRFALSGFVTGTSVTIRYFGPDGTVGASQPFTPTRSGENEVPPVVLDSSVPRIVAITPDNGAIEVPLDATVEVAFSEPIAPAFLTTNAFRLQPSGSSSPVPVAFSTRLVGAGQVVTLTPVANLASHQLYTLVVSGSVTDLTGHPVGADRGSSFTTSDRTEPQIIAVRPDVRRPVPTNVPIEVEFNEALPAEDWREGGQGRMTLVRLDGEPPAPVATVAGLVSLDEATGRILSFAPAAGLERSSRYRLTIEGVRDRQGNALNTQAIDLATVDDVAPFVDIVAPGAEAPLVSGLFYATTLDLREGSSSGATATDVDRVEYFHRFGDGEWSLVRIVSRSSSNPGFSWSFAAPADATAYGLRVVAWDTSGNESVAAEKTYSVVPDAAPSNVVVAVSRAGESVVAAYPGATLRAEVTFDEAGLSATWRVAAMATMDGATVWESASAAGELVRAHGAPWPEVTYAFALPQTLPAGAQVRVEAVVTDSASLVGRGDATILVLADAGRPVVAVVEPVPDTEVTDGGLIHVRATASDAEVGVTRVRAFLGATATTLTKAADGGYEGDIIAPDVSGTEPVTFDLVVEAEDFAGNVSDPATVPLRITPVYDPTAPVITTVCGTEGAMLPTGVTFELVVDVAPGPDTSQGDVTEVTIDVDGESTVLPRSADGRYRRSISTVGRSGGETIAVRVDARTAGSGFVSRAWGIDIVDAIDLTGRTIEDGDLRFDGQSVFVAGGRATIRGVHAFANVIVMGASTLTTASGERLRFSATNTYVACGGKIDADGLGSAPVPADFRAGSHGGLGAGGARPSYGSLVRPRSLGNAGGPNPAFSVRIPNPGGGAVELTATRLTLDGSIGSNGTDARGDSAGGSGGSILLDVGSLAAGRDGLVEAKGRKGAAGGRIAIHSTDRPDIDLGRLDASGHGSTSFPPATDRGSSGTIYLREGDVETLIVDNRGVLSSLVPTLPLSGTRGVAVDAWPMVELDATVPEWIEGSWLECSSGGVVVGGWRIAAREDATHVVLEGDAPAVGLTGASCRGYWRFDRVVARNGGRYAIGDARVPAFEGTTDALVRIGSIDVPALTVAIPVQATGVVEASALDVTNGGVLEVPGRVSADRLTVRAGARITQAQTPLTPTTDGPSIVPMIDLVVSEKLVVDGSVDATGGGFRGSVQSHGRTWPGAAPSVVGSGGSFGGRGRNASTSWVSGSVYGSVIQPLQPGAAGAAPLSGTRLVDCDLPECSAGGGVIRITAPELELNGTIRSDGRGFVSATGAIGNDGSGAGGGIVIDVPTIVGSGSIVANGGSVRQPGGGGRIAVRSMSIPSSVRLTALGGGSATAPGTIVTRLSGETWGTLTIDNGGNTSPIATELPALGGGTALAGSGEQRIVTGRASVPAYFVGHLVEVTGPVGPRGTWRVESIDGETLTLEAGALVEPGDRWQGVLRFDAVRQLGGATLRSADPIVAPGFSRPSAALVPAPGQAPGVLAGSTVQVIAQADDLQGLTRLVATATGPVTTPKVSRSVSGTSVTETFAFTVTEAAMAGDAVQVRLDAYDEIGTRVSAGPVVLTVIADETKPTIRGVSFTPALPDGGVPSGTPITVTVDATDDVAVAEVTIEVDGVTMSDVTSPFSFDWTAPWVAASRDYAMTIVAIDRAGNQATHAAVVTVIPADGGALPTASWTCPSGDVTVPAGFEIGLALAVFDDAGLTRVEFYEEDATTPFDTVAVSGTEAAASTRVMLPSAPGMRTFRARVFDISPEYAEIVIRLDAVGAVAINPSAPDWVLLETTPGVLTGGTLVVNEARSLAGLFVLEGATVRHDDYSSSFDSKSVALDVAGPVWIECGGAIDVSGRGYQYQASYPGATVPGGGTGGSHIGEGGRWNSPESTTFGSVYYPSEAGAAGGMNGSDGGGVVRLRADRLVVDGAIRANGTCAGNGGGAGGSILLEASVLSGSGVVEARGGEVASRGAGGGGAIAIDFDTVAGGLVDRLDTRGGQSSVGLVGGAGSIVLRGPDARHGRYVVNATNGGRTVLPALGTGTAAAGSSGALLQTGRSVAVPAFFVGHWVEVRTVDGVRKGRWRVEGIAGTALTLAPGEDGDPNVATGDQWSGVYVLDSMPEGAAESADPIVVVPSP